MDTFSDLFIILLLTIAAISHLLRFLYLTLSINLFKKLKYITEPPSKLQLSLYYILVIGVCIFAIIRKLKEFN